MSKRIQERKTGEELAEAKPRPRCLISRDQLNVRQASSVESDASNFPRNPQLDSISVPGSTWKHVRSDVCERSGSSWKQVQGIENQLERTRLYLHNVKISDYRYANKVFENLRQTLCLRSFVPDEKTNVLIWWLFLSTTIKASVHLGPSYNENLVAYRNTDFEELETLFDITQRLILEHSFEILNVSTMVWNVACWMRSTLCHEQVVKWATAKVHVHSDSVLRLGKMHDHSEAHEKWKSQLKDFQQTNEHTEFQLTSSGIFSQDSHRWRFSKRSEKIWKLNR